MKKIVVSIPCYNEVNNVVPISHAIMLQFEKHLPEYDYCIQFIDNCSTDGTQEKIEELCRESKKIRAIFNIRNFGGISSYHGFLQTDGDCTIIIPCDFQVPVEIIPKLVKQWEEGHTVVCALKESAAENIIMQKIRSLYYFLYNKLSPGSSMQNFNGVGLYDASFVKLCREIDTPASTLTTAVSALGHDIGTVSYRLQKRKSGKSKANLWNLFDSAILRFVSRSMIGPRLATLGGFFMAIISALVALVYLVLKLIYWDRFAAGIAPIIILISFIGAVQLFFLGLIGEYVINMTKQISKLPRVVEKKRMGFEDKIEKT